MKKTKIFISIVIAILLIANCTIALATTINPNDFRPGTPTTSDLGEGLDLAQKIVSVINVVGTIISVTMVMTLGIKYMVGSVEQRAEYKKTMIPLLVGAILLFGTSWVLKLIYSLVPGISNSGNTIS